MKLLRREKIRAITEDEKEVIKTILLRRARAEGVQFKSLYLRIVVLVLNIILVIIAISVTIFSNILAPTNYEEIAKIEKTQTTFIVISFILLIPTMILIPISKKAIAHNRGQIVKLKRIRDEILHEYFNQKIADIKITEKLTMENIWGIYLPALKAIPSNTWINNRKILEIIPGFSFATNNGVKLHAFMIKMQIEKNYLGYVDINKWKSKKRKYKYHNYLCVIVDHPLKGWENIHFRIRPGKNTGESLENAFFNQKWNYSSNDSIKLRKLLTPWTQENLLKAKYKFNFNHLSNLTYWYGKSDGNLFIFNGKATKSLLKTIDALTEDIASDFNDLAIMIEDLAIYKTIIK